MINWIQELKERWKAESPEFWQKVLKLATIIGSSAVAVLMADKAFNLQEYGVSEIVFKICGYIITFCAAIGLSAKITKK